MNIPRKSKGDTAGAHKQMRLNQIKAAFHPIGKRYFRKEPECRYALVWILRHFNAPIGNGGIIYDSTGAAKVDGAWRTPLRDVAKPLLVNQRGRLMLAVFISKYLLRDWPLVTAGVDTDEFRPNWPEEFVDWYFKNHPAQARYKKLTRFLVFAESLRKNLAVLAYNLSPHNSRRRAKARVHLRNALIDGFARVVGEKLPNMPGKSITTRKLVAGFASDVWNEWNALDRKARRDLAEKHIGAPELAPNANTATALRLISNADRDARKAVKRYRRKRRSAARAKLAISGQNTKP